MVEMGQRGTGAFRPMGLAACAALLAASCRSPDAATIVKISDVETHWAVDNSSADTQYSAPVVRFKLTNISPEAQGSIDVTATFRRKGETATWGGDFRQVSTHSKPLPSGQSESLVLKSDTRYYSNGPVDGMFAHKDFKDATVELFVRVGAGRWAKFGEQVDVERHIGAHSVQGAATSPAASPSPAPSPAAR
jgi:hypothetical protein